MNLPIKYRPATFNEVVGQELNIKILKKQIEEKDIATGYLFSGSSGIGKTTVARIFANKLDAEIIEIDGASNNGVNEIRRIRQDTQLKSMTKDRKVYIIDEAHMITKSGANAFLKILEEPPEGVVFILATTEPEKIIPTIQTRLQHFEFTRVGWQKIKKRLEEICEKEEKELNGKVLNYISKISNGSVRSAVSILEKTLKLDNPQIEDVTNLTGSTEYNKIIEILTAIVKGETKEVLELIEKTHEEGKNLTRLIEQISYFTVELTKYAMFNNFDYIKVPAMYEQDMDSLIKDISTYGYQLRRLFNEFNELYNDLRYENDEKLLIQGRLMQTVK